MKKITLFTALILMSVVSYAQHFDIRLYGGFHVLQLSSDQNESIIDGILHRRDVNGRVGIQLGGAVTFGDRFYVQPGFQYLTTTTEIVNTNPDNNEEFKDETTLVMFSVPLKAGIRLIDPAEENFFNIRLWGGFDGAHVMSVDHGKKSGKTSDISEDDYSNLIVSADFGMGIDLAFAFIDVGYQLGLTPYHSNGDKATGNTFYGNIGLRLTL